MIERKYVKVYFRLFPEENMNWDYVKVLDDHKTIYIRCLQELNNKSTVSAPSFWTFCSERVFYNNRQQEIYDIVIENVIDKVSEGNDAIILAYGQTGSGKSSTINGLNFGYQDRGILPRFIRDLFIWKGMTETKDLKICIQISYVELSRVNINDLLKRYPNSISSLKDISKVKIKNEHDALKYLFIAEGRKEFIEDSSHRSHVFSSILTFYINTKNLQTLKVSQYKVHVIDMAGSDTIGNLTCLFKEPLDVGSANLAKTQLEQFFLTLCTNIPERIKVKQRLNFMVQFLGDSLCNSTVLRFIGHIRINREDLLITISMLRFGQLLTGLRQAKYHESVNANAVTQADFKALKDELEKLKRDNLYNSMLLNQGLDKMIYEERANQIDRALYEYFSDKINSVALVNVVDVNKALEMAKKLYGSNTVDRTLIADQTKGSRVSQSTAMPLRKSVMKSFIPSYSFTVDSVKRMSSGRDDVGSETSNKEQSPNQSSDKIKPISANNGTKKGPSNGSMTRRRSSAVPSILSSRKNSIKEKVTRNSDLYVIPEIAPEYKEAWERYVDERKEEYDRIIQLYKNNDAEVQRSNRAYFEEMEKLRKARKDLEERKHQLLLAKMTKEFQESAETVVTNNVLEAERLCLDGVNALEDRLLEIEENVLKMQSEVKAHIKVGRDMKNNLKEHFDEFCKETYSCELEPTKEEIQEIVLVEDYHDRSSNVYGTSFLATETDYTWYERLKKLIEVEQKKIALYKAKKKEWTFH